MRPPNTKARPDRLKAPGLWSSWSGTMPSGQCRQGAQPARERCREAADREIVPLRHHGGGIESRFREMETKDDAPRPAPGQVDFCVVVLIGTGGHVCVRAEFLRWFLPRRPCIATYGRAEAVAGGWTCRSATVTT